MDHRKLYEHTRAKTNSICSPLSTEDYVVQVVDFASPAKWHLGHTSWFFEAFLLVPFMPDYREYHPDFSYIFNSYYEAKGQRILRAHRGNMSRPPVNEVYEYRAYVDRFMRKLLALPDLKREVMDLIILGCNHEQQHQELLWTDLKYMLGHQCLFPAYDKQTSLINSYNNRSGWLSHEGGSIAIGHSDDGFSYDNEHGAHQVFLHPFALSETLVTNGEFLEFMEAGGYQKSEYWLDEGWHWVQSNSLSAPLYWHSIDQKWHYYTLTGLKEVDLQAQLCHISHYEASAYAEWKGLRLPTEFEWEAVADQLDWGQRWEWTNSAYLPYPFYDKPEGAVGEYNGKFMSNQIVLRGSSLATTEGHSRKTYRNFFKSQSQWQCTGIRLAKNLQ